MTERTEKDLIAATRAFTTDDVGRSWRETILTMLTIVTLGCAAAFLPWLPVRVVASIVMGLTIVRGFILYHDYQHNAILRNSKLAKSLFWAYGILVLTPVTVWKQTHNYHHANNSKIVGSHVGSYPILTVDMWGKATPAQRLLYKITRHPLNILFAYITVFGYGMCISPFLRRPAGNWDSAFALVFHFVLLGVVGHYLGVDVALLTIVLPLTVACAVGGYAFYAQHNFPEMMVQPRHEWNYQRAALESSSYMELGPVMRWFTGNIGYHHVHHLNPMIPFYTLPKAMAEIPELQNPKKTTLSPTAIAQCFQQKLWDPEQNRMVGYPSDQHSPTVVVG